MKYLKKSWILCLLMLGLFSCDSAGTEPEQGGNRKPETETGNGGYLFAHMTHKDYGKFFYSVSRDGLKWQSLNSGKVILSDYVGHPTIAKGGDGNYYMIGVGTPTNLSDENPRYPILWYSSDLVVWKRRDLDRSIFDVSGFGYKNDPGYLGAPKIFYDKDSGQFMVTWHDGLTGNDGNQEEWESKRTFYILTKDFKTFTEPKKLFNFTDDDAEMATIDVIILKDGGKYYAIIKDERWPEDSSTPKSIRVATSDNLTGPYSNPGPQISPSWREAPTLVKSMDDRYWYLYVENYQNHVYELYRSTALTGSAWSKVEFTPPVARHGWIMKLDEQTYQKVVKAYPNR